MNNKTTKAGLRPRLSNMLFKNRQKNLKMPASRIGVNRKECENVAFLKR